MPRAKLKMPIFAPPRQTESGDSPTCATADELRTSAHSRGMERDTPCTRFGRPKFGLISAIHRRHSVGVCIRLRSATIHDFDNPCPPRVRLINCKMAGPLAAGRCDSQTDTPRHLARTPRRRQRIRRHDANHGRAPITSHSDAPDLARLVVPVIQSYGPHA